MATNQVNTVSTMNALTTMNSLGAAGAVGAVGTVGATNTVNTQMFPNQPMFQQNMFQNMPTQPLMNFQQFAPQQFAQQQFLPQQFLPQQFLPQQFPMQFPMQQPTTPPAPTKQCLAKESISIKSTRIAKNKSLVMTNNLDCVCDDDGLPDLMRCNLVAPVDSDAVFAQGCGVQQQFNQFAAPSPQGYNTGFNQFGQQPNLSPCDVTRTVTAVPEFLSAFITAQTAAKNPWVSGAATPFTFKELVHCQCDVLGNHNPGTCISDAAFKAMNAPVVTTPTATTAAPATAPAGR